MQYAEYSGEEQLEECFNAALDDEQNVVLSAETSDDPVNEFALSVARGLELKPREFECRFLYDAEGSSLYEKICAQPEYYPTRTEGAILKKCAPEIASLTSSCTLIELGSGSSVKTSHLLSAYQNLYDNICYTPIDISSSALKDAGRSIINQHPDVQVVGINGTYNDSFPLIRCASPALIIFLGSTIGNFKPAEERAFWIDVSSNMQNGDYFLLGIDLIKDIDLLEAAYNDRAGVTSRFTLNYLTRMNRELGAEIDLDLATHHAYYNPDKEQVEIYIEFQGDQVIKIKPLNKSYKVCKGEKILLEISRKFNLEKMHENLAEYGLQPIRTFADDQGWFGLTLLEKGDVN